MAWWDKETFAAKRPYLEARAAMTASLRGYFTAKEFLEVETPALQVSPGLEPHLKAFKTQLTDPYGGEPRPMYLHTSPEFAMKKLLAAGLARIFQIAPTYRDGERSDTHHPAFAMLEWYRAGEPLSALIEDCGAILRATWQAVPEDLRKGGLRWNGKICDPMRRPEVLTVAEAFRRHCAGLDILATAPDPANPDAQRLRDAAAHAGLKLPDSDDWEDLFFHLFLEHIEPKLGVGAPTALVDYPLSMAALAKKSARDPRVADRVELYVAGLELANGFAELTDVAEQRRRFEADMDKKERLYGERYPIDEDFLAALEQMPEASGIALGFDRLVMLATGATKIDDVLWAPVAN
ncbi:MAG TPA: EF-P lysine aminoacylase EpmA [Alphaproteobacteria bacterium]|nr:EF-P lysine aminoacylase EpmA [Alphaproteobacteria bacterium]